MTETIISMMRIGTSAEDELDDGIDGRVILWNAGGVGDLSHGGPGRGAG